MESTDTLDTTDALDTDGASPAPAKTRRVRCLVSPEIAANVREEGESVAATINTAQAVATAAINAAKAAAEGAVANAVARRTAAFRPVLRQLGLDEETATIVGTDGHGAATVLVIDLAPTSEVPNG